MLLSGCATHGAVTSPRETSPYNSDYSNALPVADDSASLQEATPKKRAIDPYLTMTAETSSRPAVQLSHEYYLEAVDKMAQGELQAAIENFDLAVAVLLRGDVDVSPNSDARAAVDSINVLVGSAARRLGGTHTNPFDAPDGSEVPSSADEIANVKLPSPSEAAVPTPVRPARFRGESLLAGDMPLEVNNQVRAMLKVYKNQLRDFTSGSLVRSGRYLDMIHKTFEEEGVPKDLAWLAMVESGFKPTAYSRAKARGVWQFIRATGRRYGLRANWWLDERSDPVKATRAAGRHLKDLHKEFGDWYLALAAYNAGSGKVRRAIRKSGSRDYWKLARTRYLRRETKNYVPGYLAALQIASNPKAHGFELVLDKPVRYEEVKVPSPFDLGLLAEAAGIERKALRRLNPELRRMTTPGDRSSYMLKIPVGRKASFQTAINKVPKAKRLRFARHKVARGETLAGIARRYRTTVSAVMAANRLSNPHRIRKGSVLIIPSDGYQPPAKSKRRRTASSKTKTYRVRSGDNLHSIAQRHGTSVASLVRLNKLKSPNVIKPGSRLKVPSKTRRVAAKKSTKKPTRKSSAKSKRLTHKVKRGDSLYAIARNYGVSVGQLKRWNKLARKRHIQPGDKLHVYVGGT